MNNLYTFILYFFAGMGFGKVFYYCIKVFFEIMYISIFIIGYFILHIINFNWQKVRKNKTGALWSLMLIIKQGFLTALDTPDELRLGEWRYIPLFKLERM